MSQYDGSEAGWSEDYARIRRESSQPGRACQYLANAANAASNDRLQIAIHAVDEAQALHGVHDRAMDHMTDAETALEAATSAETKAERRQSARRAGESCRRAAQYLVDQVDDDLEFSSGGEFA